MERLPTELVIHILRYMSKDELKAIGFVSFEYRSLVLPFLFNRIRLWSWMVSTQGISSLIACLQSNVRLSSAIRVLDAEFKSGAYREEDLRRIMKITPSWDGLTLPAGSGLPLSVFDDQSKLRLRRLRCTGGPVGLKFNHLLLNILPACTNLVELEIPDIDNRWFQNFDASGSVAAVWINRLRKYRGPPFPLSYLHSTALCQLTSTAEVPPPMLQTLGLLVGQQLVALFVHVHLIASKDFNLIGKNHLPPLTIPSLFPNLQYVGWFLIVCAPKSASLPVDETNERVLGAIQQLRRLRRVWLTAHQSGGYLLEPVPTFIKEVQKMSLPYLHTICLWTPNHRPRSYAFMREDVEWAGEGRPAPAKWAHETNVSVEPVFD